MNRQNTISNRLKYNILHLLNSRLTSYQIAKKVGVNHTTISRLRNSPSNVGRIHLRLACKLSDFFESVSKQ